MKHVVNKILMKKVLVMEISTFYVRKCHSCKYLRTKYWRCKNLSGVEKSKTYSSFACCFVTKILHVIKTPVSEQCDKLHEI
jgi:hypothetical protein